MKNIQSLYALYQTHFLHSVNGFFQVKNKVESPSALVVKEWISFQW